MEYLVALALAVLGGIAVIELYAWLLPLSEWLTRGAARLLPREDREHCSEQWLADLETIPISLTRLLRCLDLYRAAIALRWADETAALPELKELLIAKWRISWVMKRLLWSLQIHMLIWEMQDWRYRKRFKHAAWLLASVRFLTSVADQAPIVKLEQRLDLVLANGAGSARYQRLRVELVEERAALKDLRAAMRDKTREAAQTLDGVRKMLVRYAYEAKLKRLAAGGYRCLPSRRKAAP